MNQESYKSPEKNWMIRRMIGSIIAIAACIALAAGIVGQGRLIYENRMEQEHLKKNSFDRYNSELAQIGYYVNKQLAEKKAGSPLSTEAIYLEPIKQSELTDEEGGEEAAEWQWNEAVENLNNMIYMGEYLVKNGGVEFYTTDGSTTCSSLNPNTQMKESIKKHKLTKELKEKYPVCMLLVYDMRGDITIVDSSGIKNDSMFIELQSARLKDTYDKLEVKEISNVTMLLLMNQNVPDMLDDYLEDLEKFDAYHFATQGLGPIVFCSAGIIIFLAAVLMVFKIAGTGARVIVNVPIEVVIVYAFILICLFVPMGELAYSLYEHNVIKGIDQALQAMMINSNTRGWDYILVVSAWAIYLGMIYMTALQLFQVVRKGWKTYLEENCIFYAVHRWNRRKIRKLYYNLTSFNLKDSTNRIVFRIVAVNTILTSLMCCLWIFGIGILFIYSVVLFFILKKHVEKTKADYNQILFGVQQMAEGNLNAALDEDAGMFESIREELVQVQGGFARAVEQEVKSQNLKTELISNVSHDLKTPLTAIITYVELLKDESITKEQQRTYIETLSQKSQRLKQLIEDLFEVSKLNSNNVELQLMKVDLIALMKQVEFEYEDSLKEREIHLISRINTGKCMLMLDSQKTYRVFENLFGNILKYAMPKTRAYVSLTRENEDAVITIRNTSENYLDVEGDLLTERFVRGDASRTTEGSGLGLAIVKSIVEKEGGMLQVIVDGDLFKTVIRFPDAEWIEEEPVNPEKNQEQEEDVTWQDPNEIFAFFQDDEKKEK